MSEEYLKLKKVSFFPRLPLEGRIDLTYRCNNNCRHCWLRIPADAEERKEELSFEEIKRIVDEARQMGCRKWSISGGEPMLRSDFAEIFDYLTGNSLPYSINTNGTLITPEIAKLMKRKGAKMVSLYGATAEVHDRITRRPGSFEASMQGLAYLKEAGAGFIVQLVPMKDNYHQFKDMVDMARSLSPHYRVGADWLYLSSCGRPAINKEIIRQRLAPEDVVEIDLPVPSWEEWAEEEERNSCFLRKEDDLLFASCIAGRRDFHIDPYGKMSFCCFVKDSAMRCDLRKGSFRKCWEEFIPSCADKARGGEEYAENCGRCELREDCRWCPVYAYLEHRRFSARVDYLCNVAKESKRFRVGWERNHRRYYKIAGITVQIDSDLPITDATFHPKFEYFRVDGPGEDTVVLRHHFSLPDLDGKNLGREVYRRPPWAIYKNGNSWIYLDISSAKGDNSHRRAAVFNHGHTRARIYNNGEEIFLKGGLPSLTMFSTDQILLAHILADREGCYLHSCGVNFRGKGLLFAGNSEAGKSTMATLLKDTAEILCDDRMIIRNHAEGFRIYGTWSHGEVPQISCDSAPLKAIFFLNKSDKNRLELLRDRREIKRKLLSCLIKPFITREWWEKTFSLIEKITGEIPCYLLHFDKSGGIIDILKKL